MNKDIQEKIIVLREQMRRDIHAVLDATEEKIRQLLPNNNYLEKASDEFRQLQYNSKNYPRMKSPHIRDRSFPIKISLAEELSLREESRKQNKTKTALIREGYLDRVRAVKNFERLD